MDASGWKGRCPLPLINGRRNKGYMILAWSIDRYDWYLLTSLEIAKRRFMMQAYCVKCRAKRDIKDPKAITFKNGRPATQGVCPVCGTKMFRIGKT